MFNAANEECVNAFLEGKITYTDIPDTVKRVVTSWKYTANPDIEAIEAADHLSLIHI